MMRISILATIVFAAFFSSNAAKEITIYGRKGCEPVCACYMDGIFYDEGDTFKKKGDPCTTYKCANGFYEPIYRGCDYKGICKEVGTDWSEGCMKYKCQLEEGRGVYHLVEGGCPDRYGNCVPVGERVDENCHVQECQIHGSCYELTTVSKGCSFEQQCKPLHSYWHNGCTIFGCVEEYNQLKFRVFEDEIMYWPEGDYSLLMPKEGCPSDLQHKWKNSSLIHFSDGNNFISDPFDLYGNYTEHFFDHHFCTHIKPDKEDLSFIPRYQTYWDKGEYCIFRRKSNCPPGFEKGALKFDDRDVEYTSNLKKFEEWLPDGVYIGDTVFAFCCRSDGLATEPIVLPKEHPFILFMAAGANKCQEVRGMSYELEYFYFDNSNDSGGIEKLGSNPEMKDDDNNTLLYFCYYKPFECGCTGDNGKIIELGHNFTKECVLYKCIKAEGKPYLDVLKGGCSVNGKCINENSTWIENVGEKCYVKTCKRIVDPVEGIKFEVKNKYKGCKDESECRPVGYPKKRGCYDMVCSVYGRSKEPYFRLRKAGCDDGNGNCIPLGQTFKRRCITYRCRKEPNRCDLELISGGCNYNGECHDVNSTWTIGCATVTCTMVKQKKSYLLKMEAVSQKCSFKSKCYSIGETTKDGCNTYKCVKLNGTNVRMEIAKGGCFIGNKCRDVNSTWIEGCNNFTCKLEKKNSHYYFKKSVVTMGCFWNKKCYDPGEMVTSRCMDFKCTYTFDDKSHSAYMKEVNAACQDKDGTCITLGEIVEKKCTTYRCIRMPKAYPSLKPIKRECEVNGVCKKEGMVWTDDKYCMDMECKKHPKYSIPFPQKVKSGCKINGVCKSVNESEVIGCYMLSCKELKRNGKKVTGIERKPNGCMENGVCRPFGYVKEHGCIKYVCNDNRFQLVSGGCRGRDNKCHDVGITWFYSNPRYSTCIVYKCTKTGRYLRNIPREYSCMGRDKKCHKIGELWEYKSPQYASCVYYRCKKQGSQYRNVQEKYGCLDADGKCRKPGDKGFNIKTPTHNMKNCQCVANGKRVRIKCGG